MSKKLVFLTCFALLAWCGAAPVFGEVIDLRIADGANDAEQHLGDGRMDIGSSDLELAYEDGGDPATDAQVIGLRFVDVPLTADAFVFDTYIEIEADKVDKEGSLAPVNLIIEGELSVDANAFVDDANNITARPTTTAKVMWSVPEWTEQDAKFQSPDVSSIIQEIIGQEGWAPGSAIVLILRDDADNPSTGLREAESTNGEADAAPLLHIEYAIPVTFEIAIADELDDVEEHLNPEKLGDMDTGSSDLELAYEDEDMGDPQLVGLRFTNVTIPTDSPITEAWVQFQVDETKGGTLPVNLIIQGELNPDPNAFSGDANDISSRPRTATSVQWSVPNWENVGDSGPAQTTVNIAPILQELIDQDGWASGNAMVLIFSDDPCDPSTGIRCAEAGVGDDSAMLHIEAIIDIATQPYPASGAEGVLLGTTLSWKPIAAGATREVYFGDSNEPPLVSIEEAASYYPGPTDPNTTYYWRVDEVEADGTTVHAGGLWSFTTGLSNVRADTVIASQNDDGEDHIAYVDAEGVEVADDGAESRSSSDLEMPWDGGDYQVVGLRFTDMPIPQGTPISGAYVQFTADNENLDGGPVNLIISGLLLPDTDALGGGENFYDDRNPKTTAEVAWTEIPEWTSREATDASRTPDISSIIEEIVNQDGWTSGNAIMLFIRDDETNPSADNRSALSGRAVLHVPTSNAFAAQPSPANGAENVAIDADLSWWPGLDAVSHRVFLWTDTPPQTEPLLANTTGVSLDLGQLERGTTYYWQADAIIDAYNVSTGDIWSFTTLPAKATQPSPADGAVELLDPITLQWAAPEGAVDYTVYLSEDEVIDEADLLGTIVETEVALTELTVGMTYYWRVDATHEDLTTYEGDVWQFTMFPAQALNPSPADGGLWQIGTDTQLSWTSGLGAMLHHVYVSSDKSLVDARDATVASMYWMSNTLDPGELTPATTYYWAVDEFGGVDTTPGETWSFETSGQ